MTLFDLRDLSASWDIFPPAHQVLKQIRDIIASGFFEYEFDDGAPRETSLEAQHAAAQRLIAGQSAQTEVHGTRPAAIRPPTTEGR